MDSSLLADTVVGSDYDPMLSKVIAHGANREQALERLDRALAHTAILGVQTNVEFLRFLLADERVRAGDLDTALLDERLADFVPLAAPDDVFAAAGLYVQQALSRRAAGSLWAAPSGWRVGGVTAPVRTAMQTPLRTETVSVFGLPEGAHVQVGDGEMLLASVQLAPGVMSVTVDGLRRDY
ncbi:hypothetical protein YM3MPS_38090 [Mycobacterium pseudoshottsii]|nr:Acetyl-/propionyl-coenzyme A carboxylase alpha chain [Mycobacterium marinum]BEH78006.1 hypothetical protein YM3MPS_38090 [Mycobacterium pseudoshottsii]